MIRKKNIETFYTKDDMKDLSKYLCEYIQDYFALPDTARVIDLCEYYDFDYKQMIFDSPVLLSVLREPFENMPLHINDSIEVDKALALWRMQHGT